MNIILFTFITLIITTNSFLILFLAVPPHNGKAVCEISNIGAILILPILLFLIVRNGVITKKP